MIIKFFLYKRKNIHRLSSNEWALDVFTDGSRWNIISWENKPSPRIVEDSMSTFKRACVIYHAQLKIPEIAFKDLSQESDLK